MVTKLRTHIATVIVGLFFALGIFLILLAMADSFRTSKSYSLSALVPTSASLSGGANVAMAGISVGKVRSTERMGNATLVKMDITDKRVLPIRADAQVAVRQRTPIGENYLEITQGTSKKTLADHAVLPLSASGETVDVDQILSVLQGSAKHRARELIQGLGGGLDGNGQELNDVLGDASNIVRDGGTIFVGLDKVKDQTAELVQRLGAVSSAIGERGAAIKETADRGLVALSALASRDEQLRQTLDVLPSTLRQVHETADTLKSTSATAAPVVANLAGAMHDLRPAFQNLEPAAIVGRSTVAELSRAAGPLTTTLNQLKATSGPLSSALPPIRKMLCQINPVIRYGAPYTGDVTGAVTSLASAANSYDAIGHMIRLTPILGENSISGALPENVQTAAFTLLHSGTVLPGTPLSYDPYPKPGHIGKDVAPPTGGIEGRHQLKASGFVYPHVTADC